MTLQGYFRGVRITCLTLSKHWQLFVLSVYMMVHIFGDLRQLRSFIRPPTSFPCCLRPLSNTVPAVHPPPQNPSRGQFPRQPPIILKPIHDPEKSSTSSAFTTPTSLLPPNAAPAQSSLPFQSSPTPVFKLITLTPVSLQLPFPWIPFLLRRLSYLHHILYQGRD